MQAVQLSRTHRILVGVVVTGAVVIAAIGFAGSYAAVRELAVSKGFGAFAPFFPIGIDAGIVVLLALDLLLTWIRIPFPLLRQTAWLLTAATIAFNGAAAWPDPLGVGMHAVIPVLFVVSVEAARHAIGRIADITADRHMEGVRIARWLLAFPSTFRLWRRMKLWELRSYDQVIRMEQDRLVYEARLRARFGRGWRRKAPVEALMPLRLARYGVPLAETGQAGMAAIGEDHVRFRGPQREDDVLGALELADQGPEGALETTPRHELEQGSNADEQPDSEERWTAVDDAAVTAAVSHEHAPEPAEDWGTTATVATSHPSVERNDGAGGHESAWAEVPRQAGTVAQLLDQAQEPEREAQQSEPLRGKAGLETLYWQLPAAERGQSSNSLAPRLARQVGLSEGTTRKYLGQIKRAARS